MGIHTQFLLQQLGFQGLGLLNYIFPIYLTPGLNFYYLTMDEVYRLPFHPQLSVQLAYWLCLC